MWIWRGQWPLDFWFNRLLTVPRGYSFVGVFNKRLDGIFVEVLRKWHRDLAARLSAVHH